MTADRRPPEGASRAGEPARRNAWAEAAPRMRELTHVHGDHDPRAWHWFTRGPLVAADGGRRGDGEEPRGRDVEDERLRDVSHQPAHGADASEVWHRGDETEDHEE